LAKSDATLQGEISAFPHLARCSIAVLALPSGEGRLRWHEDHTPIDLATDNEMQAILFRSTRAERFIGQ
jgi:hypothetical protein